MAPPATQLAKSGPWGLLTSSISSSLRSQASIVNRDTGNRAPPDSARPQFLLTASVAGCAPAQRLPRSAEARLLAPPGQFTLTHQSARMQPGKDPVATGLRPPARAGLLGRSALDHRDPDQSRVPLLPVERSEPRLPVLVGMGVDLILSMPVPDRLPGAAGKCYTRDRARAIEGKTTTTFDGGCPVARIVLEIPDDFNYFAEALVCLAKVVCNQLGKGHCGAGVDYSRVETSVREACAAVERSAHQCLLQSLDVDAPRVTIGGKRCSRVGRCSDS